MHVLPGGRTGTNWTFSFTRKSVLLLLGVLRPSCVKILSFAVYIHVRDYVVNEALDFTGVSCNASWTGQNAGL